MRALTRLASVKMKEDNTPTVTARRRKPTPHMRLRLETAKKLETLSKRIQAKREKAKQQKLDQKLEQELAKSHIEQIQPPPPRIPKPKRNKLAEPDKPAAKFRKRQINKSWLPTHVWHAKRAHMPDPKAPLWRFAVPSTPTAKVHRPTHRAASSRGCVAWDTSYTSTISIEGVEASLLGLLRDVGVEELMLVGKRGAKWRSGTRSWHGWIRERDHEKRWLSTVDIIWCTSLSPPDERPIADASSRKKPNRQIFLRTHPSSFLLIWNELLKDVKIQHPSPSISDLRFEIGSIEITGPNSTEALVGILHPVPPDSASTVDQLQPSIATAPSQQDTTEKIWPHLSSLTNPSALGPNALLALNIHDPRLFHPPRTVPSPPPGHEDTLLDLLASWPPDANPIPAAIFSSTARHTASRLPSQKAINRRKGSSPPGTYPPPLPTDPAIPILLYTSRAPSLNQQGTWTVLLPWKCVLPTWYSLVHYPLSSGSNPRFGGLNELRQMRFERGEPWFPGDYPGTEAGWAWELGEREKWKRDWEKRPKGKRVSWDAVDLGDGKKGEVGKGWACDWERLFLGPPAPNTSKEQAASTAATDPPTTSAPDKDNSPPKPTAKPANPPPQTAPSFSSLHLHHLPSPLLKTLPGPTTIPPHTLSTIRLSLLHRGTPSPCARIYRLPTTDPPSLQKWLALLSSLPSTTSSTTTAKNQPTHLPADAPPWEKRQALARQLLGAPIRVGEKAYPVCPEEGDLIGFVTTGGYDLGAGRGMGVGCLAVGKVLGFGRGGGGEEEGVDGKEGGGKEEGKRAGERGVGVKGLKREDRICVVRDAGQSVGRLARWEFV
jgi:ribonuclease P/MRP protein subunit POP1